MRAPMVRSRFIFGLLRRAAHFSSKITREPRSSRRKVSRSSGANAEGARTVKLMTYNVWTHEDVAIDRRIKAFGQLIHHHSPEVIMFQEVTPNMGKKFQNSEWRMDYKYMLPQVPPTDKSSFCVMMSKYPMKAKKMELDSLDESKFCVASLSIRGRRLVTATCHLKSPTAPKNPSTEMRKRQAGELLGELARWPNAVVGGDMNWIEDGIADLPWVDAWAVLRGGEVGNTYDTVRNKMIANNNKVQKRLDRFICKLRDFRLEDVKIIGTEAVDDEPCSYRGKEVPLLPSDHFGLLLAISSAK